MKEIVEYENKCLTCQKVKEASNRWIKAFENSRLKVGFNLNGLIMGLPLSPSKKTILGVIVDTHTKSTHFIPIHDTWGVERLGQLYVKEIF